MSRRGATGLRIHFWNLAERNLEQKQYAALHRPDGVLLLLDKIEQVIRLVRSKGVGVFFVTQNPLDVPDIVLGQLGNRVQHALRAFTPRDQKAVKAAASTMRANPALDTEKAITELGVGEALISFLDEKGRPGIVERAFILPPASRIGSITADERKAVTAQSPVKGVYDAPVDRESAYEKLAGRASASAGTAAPTGRCKRRPHGFAEGIARRPDDGQRTQGQPRRSNGEERRADDGLDRRTRDRSRGAGFAARRAPTLTQAILKSVATDSVIR